MCRSGGLLGRLSGKLDNLAGHSLDTRRAAVEIVHARREEIVLLGEDVTVDLKGSGDVLVDARGRGALSRSPAPHWGEGPGVVTPRPLRSASGQLFPPVTPKPRGERFRWHLLSKSRVARASGIGDPWLVGVQQTCSTPDAPVGPGVCPKSPVPHWGVEAGGSYPQAPSLRFRSAVPGYPPGLGGAIPLALTKGRPWAKQEKKRRF